MTTLRSRLPLLTLSRGALALTTLSWLACAAPQPQPQTQSQPARTLPAAVQPAPTPTPTPTLAPSGSASAIGSVPSALDGAAKVAPESPAPVVEVALGEFVNDLVQPVWSLALGRPKVAALGTSGWLLTNGKWQELPFPAALGPGTRDDGARIFFGRDDLPRVMGGRADEGGKTQVYLRYRQGRWLAEKHEVGRLLGAPKKALWGVLGHADPEVACKQDDVCIVKRLTGWKTIPAGPGAPLVELWGDDAWALAPDHLAKLSSDTSFEVVATGAPFTKAEGFSVTSGVIWVSEPSMDKLHVYRGGAWSSTMSPTPAPRGLWAEAADDVWLVGGAGLFHFDGARWSKVKGPVGPLRDIRVRRAEHGEREVWIAGETGVWSSRRR